MKIQTQLRTYFSRLDRKSRCRRRRFAASGASGENLESRLVLSSVSVLGNQVVFLAGNGETNDVVVSEAAGVITIQDTTSPITSVSAEYTIISANEVTIPATGFNQLNVNLLDGDDTFDASGLTVASGLRRTVIQGGTGNDWLVGSGLDDIFVEETGSDFIDGLTAISVDQWSVSRDADMVLTDTALTIGLDVDTYANIEAVGLNGGAGDNTIDASAATPASGITGINFNGGAGNDTLKGGTTRDNFQDRFGLNTFTGGGGSAVDSIFFFADEDMFISDTTVTSGSSMSGHSGIERVDLWGGAGDNVIDASAVTLASGFTFLQIQGFEGDDTLIGSPLDDTIRDGGGANALDGGGGFDQLIIDVDANQVATNTTIQIDSDLSTHANFERLSMAGGASDNLLDASAIDAVSGFDIVNLDGRTGADTIIGSSLADNITDGFGNNHIDGGPSPIGTRDRWQPTSRNVDFTATDGIMVIGTDVNTFVGIEDLRMIGSTGDNVLDSSQLTAASGVTLNLMSALPGDDILRPSSDPGIVLNLNGGGSSGFNNGFDTLDLSHFPSAPTIVINGAGTEDGDLGFFAGGTFNNINNIILPPEYDFSAATYSVEEGNVTNTTSVIEVTRSVNTDIASSVEVVLTGGTAGVGDDFTGGPVTVNFLPGDVTQSVPIQILGDTDVESDETISLSLTDGILGSVNPTATLTILNDDVSNLPPELLSISSDATFTDKAEAGETVSVLATFSDPNSGDTHTATIDWGDGTTTAGLVDQFTGEITGDHLYSTGGIFDVTVTIDDGIATDDAMTTAVVSGVRLTDDGTLQIIGTDDRDRVQVKHQGSNIRVKLKQANGPTQHHDFTASGITSILIHTCDGNDRIQLHHNIDLPTVINAGAGHDEIQGGSGDDLIRAGSGHDFVSGGQGHDIILGGEGHDLLFGDSGRDILIGGDEFDVAFGGSGEDILIGGSTIHDNDNAALNSIRDEWTSNKSLGIRKQNLIDGTGDGSGLNGTAFLDSLSLIDDNAFDLLFGGWGADWLPEH